MTGSCTHSETTFVELAKQLPSGPRLLTEVGQMVRSSNTTIEELVEVLRRDAAIVARLLRMANSAMYARAEPIGSVDEAVLTIGFTEVHRMIGALAATQLSDISLSLHGVSGTRYRENALYTACVLQEFAAVTGRDQQAFYTAGLLRTLGMIVLERLAKQERSFVPPFSQSGEADLWHWQRNHWGLDSSFVTAKVLRHWQMPGEIATAVECHLLFSDHPAPEAALLRLAAIMAANAGYGIAGEALGEEGPTRIAGGIEEEDFLRAVERGAAAFRRMHASVL